MIHGSSWNKLWIIGLSRTGTMSLTKTINRHSRFAIEHYPALWKLESTYYEGNGAADIVVSAMFEKLDKKYPGSKFILTLRDKESWLKSTEKFITTKDRMKKEWLKKNNARPNYPSQAQIFTRNKLYGSVEFDAEIWSKGFDTYHERVRDHFKYRKDDLLEIDFISGDSKPKEVWKFLDIQDRIAPSEFVHANEFGAQLEKWKRQ